MNVLGTLLRKEFKQISRNSFMLPVIFIIPVVQLLVLVYAANLEMKNINLLVVDNDLSHESRSLISHFSGSPYYTVLGSSQSYKKAEEMIIKDEADVILTVPNGFSKGLVNEKEADVQLVVNAINATEAGLINSYTTQIISAFNKEIRMKMSNGAMQGNTELDFSIAYWYNPLLDYKIYMVSGILVVLVTLIGMFLTALNLVREKELGTAEQMNVTPMRKYQFILSKLLPFLLIGLFELSFGLVIGRLFFDLPIRGSLLLLFGIASVYLVVALGLGLFLSTISNTQQQMMFMAFFFLITFVLMSGVFTPAESMPQWAQKINLINPIAYFMKAIRMILLKGSSFADVSREFFSLLGYAVVILSFSIFNYRKTT